MRRSGLGFRCRPPGYLRCRDQSRQVAIASRLLAAPGAKLRGISPGSFPIDLRGACVGAADADFIQNSRSPRNDGPRTSGTSVPPSRLLSCTRRSRRAERGAALPGLTSRRGKSGDSARQLPITKAGAPYLRRLLVGPAHHILASFGPNCDLRRFGRRTASRGAKKAKK